MANDEIIIRGDTATVKKPDGKSVKMSVSELFEQAFPKRIDSCGIRLPPEVRFAYSRGRLLILACEYPPGPYTLSWIADDSPAPYGPEAKYQSVTLSLPYIIVLAAFDGTRLSDFNECFFRTAPLTEIEDEANFTGLHMPTMATTTQTTAVPAADQQLAPVLARDGLMVRLIGLGGIGGIVARYSSIFLASLRCETNLLLIDGDAFEPKNATRMLFSGYGNKAEVVRAELLESLVDSRLNHKEIDQPAKQSEEDQHCTDILDSVPQLLFANLMTASAICNTFWLYLCDAMHYSELGFDIVDASMRPLGIPAPTWPHP